MAEEVIELSSDDEECGASNSKLEAPATDEDWNQPSTSRASGFLQPMSSVLQPSNSTSNSKLNGETFPRFVEFCKTHISKNDVSGLNILTLIQTLYEKMDTESKDDESFVTFLMNIESKITKKPQDIFVYIKELSDEMKLYIHKPQRGNNCDNLNSNSSEMCENDEKKKKLRKHIRYLERVLKQIHKKIKKLEAKELSLDDMNKDSDHILEARYKKRFMDVFKKLCELNKSEEKTDRCIEKKFNYKGSRFQEINRKVSKYINRYKEVPEYPDILELVNKVNNDHNLLVNTDDEAQKVFTEVVKILRDRRLMDYYEGLDTHGDAPDPIEGNLELTNMMEERRRTRIQQTDDIMNDFVLQQRVLEENRKRAVKREDSEHNGDEKEEVDESESATPEKKKDDLDEDSEDDEEEDDEANEMEKCDIKTISEEFKDELEADEPGDQSEVENSETDDEEESDVSDEENGFPPEHQDNENSPHNSEDLPNSLQTISLTKNSIKRPIESLSEDEPTGKRPRVLQSPVEEDDVIVLD